MLPSDFNGNEEDDVDGDTEGGAENPDVTPVGDNTDAVGEGAIGSTIILPLGARNDARLSTCDVEIVGLLAPLLSNDAGCSCCCCGRGDNTESRGSDDDPAENPVTGLPPLANSDKNFIVVSSRCDDGEKSNPLSLFVALVPTLVTTKLLLVVGVVLAVVVVMVARGYQVTTRRKAGDGLAIAYAKCESLSGKQTKSQVLR